MASHEREPQSEELRLYTNWEFGQIKLLTKCIRGQSAIKNAIQQHGGPFLYRLETPNSIVEVEMNDRLVAGLAMIAYGIWEYFKEKGDQELADATVKMAQEAICWDEYRLKGGRV